ncbi:MAG: putative sulfurtransferase DsrE [Candidatus Scalindua rubra]|uniref:Putative sulfurtransferase DsrE n=1 Tax=Candidatus Scalindua rubra TaxID=1872076 RepID=A0A1E3XAF6_9BACT|nr:MAG: putative sulfurtransferase DsrE [Candidatus Scalindua rubra]
MAKLGILLTLGPFQFENWETASNVANAALDKGHEVQMFFYLDGVYNPIKCQTFPDWSVLPKDRFAELVKKGANIIACGVCVNARGLEKGKDYIDGVTVGGLPDFAQIMSEVDSLVTL